MTFEHKQTSIGLALGLLSFAAYWVVVLIRAGTDGLPFTEVAWQGPLLVAVIAGGVAYAATFGVLRWRARGEVVTDARDREIAMHAELAGAGPTGLAVLATMILLALDADTFWAAHVLFVGTFLGTVITASVALAAYREGL
ncbi:hypothetical protein [Demequina zhanjiangensis]|uniref:DUF2178 domain-containing protein n=1 Tax=Demequina zhanjiangensis TaxID=3051659 RepID=A0ABT8G5F5_9MICO|nr:hypothetical protein [Demequina sp. SYSU T00b26]MDN4474159.1 hypothetical protein [Demequina sp. SYSU T00b26]